MIRRIALVFALSAVSVLTNWARAQELLTNAGLELVFPNGGGPDSAPPGWKLEEGPRVPNLPGPYRGDYNNSGVTLPCPPTGGCGAVDAADYTVWRDHLGQVFPLPNRHPSLTGQPISIFDYDIWKLEFGRPRSMDLAQPGNFSHLQFEGDWHMWFQPYNGTQAGYEDNFAHLTQTVSGTPGLNYTMTGYALFEDHFPGGATNLNLANPDGTGTGAPFDDGPLSPTDTFFALEFLDNNGTVLDESVAIELKAAGQLSNTFWQMHTLSAIAPAGTVNVRVRASMIDGIENPLPCPQCFQMSFFVDAFSLTAQPAGSGAGAVPEPASWWLGAIAIGATSVFRCRKRTSRA